MAEAINAFSMKYFEYSDFFNKYNTPAIARFTARIMGTMVTTTMEELGSGDIPFIHNHNKIRSAISIGTKILKKRMKSICGKVTKHQNDAHQKDWNESRYMI